MAIRVHLADARPPQVKWNGSLGDTTKLILWIPKFPLEQVTISDEPECRVLRLSVEINVNLRSGPKLETSRTSPYQPERA
jgi:hypothetical protein